jgi:hypothetical protein
MKKSWKPFFCAALIVLIAVPTLTACKIPRPPRVPGPIQPPAPPGTSLRL